ncbi:MAG: hypothetical protein Q8P57_05095 [Candidatus Pacearchaeota archaeon]|nr:hypothetical protein [Candidatus Pacearchaeota archaeon]
MKKKENGLEGLVKRITKQINAISDGRPSIFLDTSAIIDIETELENSPCSSPDFYRSLVNQNYPLFVSNEIFKETKGHYENHRVHGRREISERTFDFVKRMNKAYKSLLSKTIFDPDVDIELLGLNVHLAGRVAFEKGHKKCERDEISYCDLKLVTSALSSRYLLVPSPKKFVVVSGLPIENLNHVVVLSADEHVQATIDLLKIGVQMVPIILE